MKRAVQLFVVLLVVSVAALVMAGAMNLTLPTVGSTVGPTWATQINTALTTIEAHDHTSGKGNRITSSALNMNAATEMNSQNLTEIKGLLFDNNGSTQTGTRSLWVFGNNLYYRNASSQNVQITSGSALNGSATGGFSGDYVGNATAYYDNSTGLFAFYAANAATFDTSALAKAKADGYWVADNSAGVDDFLLSNDAGVLSLGSDTDDNYTIEIADILSVAGSTGVVGVNESAATAAAMNASYLFGETALSTTNHAVFQGTVAGEVVIGDSNATPKYYGIRSSNGAMTIHELTDALAVATTPLTLSSDGAFTIAAATSGTELTVTGEVSVSSTSTFTGLITATAGVTTGATGVVTTGSLASASNTIAADITTPDVAGKSVLFTSANSGATAITDLTNPATGQIVIICGGSATNSSTIADSGNFNLSAAFTASVDDCITLYVVADNDYIELTRVNN